MWNDIKDQIVMVAEWDDEDVDKDEAGHMIDFIRSIKELNDAMQPFKDQLKDLKSRIIKGLSVPPEKILKPLWYKSFDKTLAFLITSLVYV